MDKAYLGRHPGETFEVESDHADPLISDTDRGSEGFGLERTFRTLSNLQGAVGLDIFTP